MSQEHPSDHPQWSFTLEAGEAFGSGAHPTTALMLQMLAILLPGLPQNSRLLDYGCGSGILTLAAAQRCDISVIACDLDPAAVAATQRNAGANQVSDRITAFRADRPSLKRIVEAGPYSLIMANILAEVLLLMLPFFKTILAKQGLLQLSGILRWQRPWFEEGAAAAGLALVAAGEEGDWCALCYEAV